MSHPKRAMSTHINTKLSTSTRPDAELSNMTILCTVTSAMLLPTKDACIKEVETHEELNNFLPGDTKIHIDSHEIQHLGTSWKHHITTTILQITNN